MFLLHSPLLRLLRCNNVLRGAQLKRKQSNGLDQRSSYIFTLSTLSPSLGWLGVVRGRTSAPPPSATSTCLSNQPTSPSDIFVLYFNINYYSPLPYEHTDVSLEFHTALPSSLKEEPFIRLVCVSSNHQKALSCGLCLHFGGSTHIPGAMQKVAVTELTVCLRGADSRLIG